MRIIGSTFILIGAILVIYFGYQYWYGFQGVERIEKDIVLASSIIETENDRVNIFDETEIKPDINFAIGEEIGKLVIPTIELSFDVFWGTDEKTLSKGVGMYDSQWTTKPSGYGHTVVSGHRDTVFRPVGDLEIGDYLYLHYENEDYQYEIVDIWITDANDHSVIVEKDEPTLTLTTCYPFYFIGDAPERYIIEAKLVNEGKLLDM